MKSEDNVESLTDSLQSDGMTDRHRALTTIKSGEFSDTEAKQLIGPVVELLEDSVAWVQQVAPGAVVSLAESHPGILGPVVADQVSSLSPYLDDENREVRGSIATLLGATGRKPALQELNSRHGNEVDTVAHSIEQGLRLGCDNIIHSLLENDHDEEDSLAQGLLLLARQQPDIVIEHESELFDMLDGPNGDIVGQVFIELMRTSSRTELSVSTLREAVSVEADADEGRIVAAANAIDAVVRGQFDTDEIVDDIDRFGEWLEADQADTQQRAIKLLTPVAKNSALYLDDHIDAIADLIIDDGAGLKDEARELLFRYSEERANSPRSYLRTLLRSTGGLPAFDWLTTQLGVLYYDTEDEWIEPTKGTLGRGLVDGLQRAYKDERTAPVIWPTYEPRVTVTAAMSVLLECVPARQNVVLYCSGSQNHWGGKGDIREEYARYALEVPSSINGFDSDYHRFDELLPTEYVSQGTRKTKGDRPGPASLVLVSRDEQLRHVDAAGPTLFDFHAKVSEEEEDLVDEILEVRSNRLVCSIYSLYTKQEHDGNRVPDYGLPKVDRSAKIPDTRTVMDTLQSESSGTEVAPGFPTNVDDTFRRLASPRDIHIKSVDVESIRDELEEGYDAVNFLLDNGAEHAGWRSFSYLQRFERLSVPAEAYDEWVRDKRRRGKRGQQSWMMTEFVEEFGEYSIKTDGIARPGTSDVHEELATIAETLAVENPLFESICRNVREMIDDGQRVAVFAAKPSLRKVLKEQLREKGTISKHQFRKGQITLVDRDSIRSLQNCDHLLIPGPQARRYAGFHIHPNPDQITVLSYGGRWSNMIERRVNRWIDQLNDVLRQTDANPIAHAEVTVERDVGVGDAGPTEGDEEPVEAASGTQETSQGDSEAAGLQEQIAVSLDESEFGDQFTYERDRYDDYQQQRFAIETTSGERIYRDAGNRIIVEDYVLEDLSKRTTYKWASPSELSIGATILDVDRSVWNDIWDEWLDEKYADIDGGGVTEYLAQWHEMLTEILEEIAEESESPESAIVLGRVIDRIDRFGIERNEGRIRAWFQSVVEASEPLDLARDPSLTMAPRNSEDIDTIGRVFSKSELQGKQAQLITEARDKIHGAHIKEGHEFREEIIEELEAESGLATRILEGSQRFEVADIVDVTDSEDE